MPSGRELGRTGCVQLQHRKAEQLVDNCRRDLIRCGIFVADGMRQLREFRLAEVIGFDAPKHLSLYKAFTHGPNGRLGTIGGANFAKNMLNVLFHSFVANV